jgi:hypothetical protein
MTVVPYDRPVALDARRTSAGFNADWLLDPAEIANRIGGTDFVPKALRNNPAAITAALLYGQEVGLGPMMSLSRIAVIDGRPSLAAEAQRALILADGHDLWIEESTVTRCTIAGRRKGSELVSRVTWTLDDAKRAKIAGRSNWQAYPRAMLLARASAELARAIFADVIGGLAATEELEDVDVIVEAPAVELEGPEAKPATRRRRRVGTTAGPGSSASPAPEPEPSPAPSPEPEPEPAQPTEPKQPPAAGAAPADAPSKAAMGMLFALFGQKGVGEREARLAYSERALDRSIGSSSELSALDVSRIIEALNAEPDKAEPRPEPEPFQAPPLKPEPAPEPLPADEQAVLDALGDELGAKPANPPYGEFPEGY